MSILKISNSITEIKKQLEILETQFEIGVVNILDETLLKCKNIKYIGIMFHRDTLVLNIKDVLEQRESLSKLEDFDNIPDSDILKCLYTQLKQIPIENFPTHKRLEKFRN